MFPQVSGGYPTPQVMLHGGEPLLAGAALRFAPMCGGGLYAHRYDLTDFGGW
jgi:sulfatase maturation enzyme AslB (radical SAM superfamily)